MSNQAVVEQLKNVLAESYALYIKTQNFHWNVTGPNFSSLHTLFQTQYEDLALAIDEVAERIRALGEKAPGGLGVYAQRAAIKDGDSNADATTMLKELAADQDKICAALKRLHDEAEKADDQVTVDLCVGRLTIHQKNAWMLRASV